MKKTEPSVTPKAPKPEKEKTNTLEGYDLNNFASVVIIDDQPQVTTDDPELICDSENGFQEVTSKKRHKIMADNEVKKLKKEVSMFLQAILGLIFAMMFNIICQSNEKKA